MTAKQIAEEIRSLREGESWELLGVHIFKRKDLWWVQAGGGAQFSRTPEAAARKGRRLMPKR